MQPIKLDRNVKSPCYNEKTKTSCERRAVGCREKCNRYKIYRTLKEVERKQKQKAIDLLHLEIDMSNDTAKRLKRIHGKRGEKY